MTACWGIARRYLLRMRRSVKNIIVSVLTPVILLLFFGPAMNSLTKITLNPSVSSSIDYISFFVPGIIALTLFYAAIFSASNVVQIDKFTDFDEILDMTPNSPQTIVLGYALGGFIHTLFEVILVIAIAELTTLLPVPIDYLFYNMVATILTIGTFLFIGMAIAKSVEWEHYTLILSILTLPVVYLSTIFAPAYAYSQLNWIVAINPLSLLLDGYRVNLLPLTPLQSLVNIIALMGYCLGSFLLCVFAFDHVPRATTKNSVKISSLTRQLQNTESVHAQVLQKLGKNSLGTIYQLLLDGKKEEAIKLFTSQFTNEEIKQLFKVLAKS